MQDAKQAAGDFWRASLELYAREGMARALIALQDRRGADVNLLLYCCWTAQSGRDRLYADDLRRAEAAIAGWREDVTIPLRALRTRIKDKRERWIFEGASEVRRAVLETEIASERVTQGILERMAAVPGDNADGEEGARANLLTYFEVLGAELDESDRADLETILAGAYRSGPP